MKKVTITIQENQDSCNIFTEGNYVISNNKTVILITCNSKLEGGSFEGVCVNKVTNTLKEGYYSKDWDKSSFRQFEGEINIKVTK
jgi:hypothetical protein